MPILPGNVLQRRHLAEGDISGELKIKQEGDASSLDGLTLDSAVEQLFQDRAAGDTALSERLDTLEGSGPGSLTNVAATALAARNAIQADVNQNEADSDAAHADATADRDAVCSLEGPYRFQRVGDSLPE